MNKLKPKELRDKLFLNGRPHIRALELVDEQGNSKDMGIIWAAYSKGSFSIFPERLTRDEFTSEFVRMLSTYNSAWLVEDNNKSFGSGYGAIGLIVAVANTWELEPHFLGFDWTTTRNKIRGYVSFFQMMRYDKTVGIVNIHVVDVVVMRFLKKLHKYGVINYTGVIPKGDINGDRHIFYVRGKKRINRPLDGERQTSQKDDS